MVRHAKPTVLIGAAKALADLSPVCKDNTAKLFTPMTSIRAVSVTIARAAGEQAITDGLASVDRTGLETEIQANVWEPAYQLYELSMKDEIG